MSRAFSEQDILSRTFGELKPLELIHEKIGGKPARYWKCRCSCGKEVTIWQHSLVRPDGVNSCGDRIHRIENLTGRKFGRLVVLRLAPQSAKKYRGATWVCDCDCGRKGVLIRGRKLQQGTPSCGCWAKEHLGQATKLPYGEAGVGILFSSYRCGARGRKLTWSLEREDFKKLVIGDCHYCGASPARVIRTYDGSNLSGTFNGVDRMDSLKGYELGNVVSCCKTCNMAKGTKGYQEFLDYLEQVKNFWNRKVTSLEQSVTA